MAQAQIEMASPKQAVPGGQGPQGGPQMPGAPRAPGQCGQCDQTFKYEKNLTAHIGYVHLSNFKINLDLTKENKLSWDLLEKFKNAHQFSDWSRSKELNDLLFQELKTSSKREADLKSKMEIMEKSMQKMFDEKKKPLQIKAGSIYNL